jgi:hypothetical protein
LDLNGPGFAVTVCASVSRLVQVTVVPTLTVMLAGENANPWMATAFALTVGPGAAAELGIDMPDIDMPDIESPGGADAAECPEVHAVTSASPAATGAVASSRTRCRVGGSIAIGVSYLIEALLVR